MKKKLFVVLLVVVSGYGKMCGSVVRKNGKGAWVIGDEF